MKEQKEMEENSKNQGRRSEDIELQIKGPLQQLEQTQRISSQKVVNLSTFGKFCRRIGDCYHKCGAIINRVMHTLVVNIIIFVGTMFALFNNDIRLLATTISVDPTFAILNEIVFFILTLEFVILVAFEDYYIFSFFFFMDGLAVLSMIPDTEFIMNAITQDTETSSHASVSSVNHFIKASSASQAGARASRYVKLVRIMSFIKIIRLAKLLDTVKELKPVNTDTSFSAKSLADASMITTRRSSKFGRRVKGGKLSIEKEREIKARISQTNSPMKKFRKINSASQDSPPKHSIFSTKFNVKKSAIMIPTTGFRKVTFVDNNASSNNNIDNSQNLLLSAHLKPKNSINNNEKENKNENENITRFLNGINILESEDKDESASSGSLVINSEVRQLSKHSQRSKYSERTSRITKIRREQIEIFDNNGMNQYIESGAFSDGENLEWKNPVKLEMDNFLEKNAIDLDDLINDRSLILIHDNPVKKKPKQANLLFGLVQKALDKTNPNHAKKVHFSLLDLLKEKINTSNANGRRRSSKFHNPILLNNNHIPKNNTINTHKSSHRSHNHNNVEEVRSNIPLNEKDETKSKKKNIFKIMLKKKKLNSNNADKENKDDKGKLAPVNLLLNDINADNISDNVNAVTVIHNHKKNGVTVFGDYKELKKENDEENMQTLKKTKSKIEEKRKKYHREKKTLQDILSEKLTQKLVTLMMVLLVVVPVLDSNYLSTFLDTPDSEGTVQFYCLRLIDEMSLHAMKDSVYLTGLSNVFASCIDISESGDKMNSANTGTEEPFFLFFNFSDYNPFLTLKEKYQNTNYSDLIPNITYTHPDYTYMVQNKREEYNYMTRNYNSLNNDSWTIEYVYNNNQENNLDSLLNIIKVVYIAILLITGSFMFSNDINFYVTLPLDKAMTRLQVYLNNTDSWSDEIDMKNLDKMDVKVAYKKALLMIDEKKNKNGTHKGVLAKKMETNEIDRNIQILINLVSISIGKPILNIILESQVGQSISFNLKTNGVKCKSAFLMMKISNTNEFIEKYKEKAHKIFNKIYFIFHIFGVIYLGDIYTGKDVLIWKENRNNVVERFKAYTNSLIDKKGGFTSHSSKDYAHKIKEKELKYTQETVVYLSLLCAHKIINAFYSILNKTISKLKDHNVSVDFLLGYGEHLLGYIGEDYKLDEAYISPHIIEASRILKHLSAHNLRTRNSLLNKCNSTLKNSTFKNSVSPSSTFKIPALLIKGILPIQQMFTPSLFIHESIYELLDLKFQDMCYPVEILKVTSYSHSKSYRLYKQHLDYQNMDRNVNANNLDAINSTDVNKDLILAERSKVLDYIIGTNHQISDFVLNDREFQVCHFERFPPGLLTLLRLLFEYFYSNKLQESIVTIRRIKRNEDFNNFLDSYINYAISDIERKCKTMISQTDLKITNFTTAIDNW